MSTRSEALAKKVEQANNDLLAAVEGSSDEQWSAKCADNEWSQGFAGYHAASSIGFIAGMVQGFAAGQPFTPTSMTAIDEGNAATAKEHANCTKAEALSLIKQNAPGAASTVRALTDEQLDQKVKLLEDAPEFGVEQVIEMLLVGHTAGHTQSIVGAR